MMSKKRPLTTMMIIVVALAVVVCVWLVFFAPVFQEKERLVRSENAALAKDIAEIEAMNGNMEELENMIAVTEEYLASKYASRADTARDAAARIESICAELGYKPTKIALSQENMLHPAGTLAPALYSVDITFLIEDDEEVGAAVIRGLERYPTADFEVTGFVYRATPPEAAGDEDEDEETTFKGEWIITATLYYYE